MNAARHRVRPGGRPRLCAGLAVVGVASLLLAGCGTAGDDTSGDGGGNSDEYVIGISWSALQTEYFVGLRDGAEAAAAEAGMKVISLDANDDAVTQVDQINDLVSQQPDVIVVNPVDSSAVASTVKQVAADIPVFTLDRQVEGVEDDIVTHVGASAEEGGYNEAQLLCEAVGPDATFLGLWGPAGVQTVEDRVAGVERGATDNGCNLEMVGESFEQGEGAEAAAVTTGDWLQAYADGSVDAIIAYADSQALGALQELRARSRTDVVVIGAANFGGFHDAICAGDEQALGSIDFNLAGQGKKLVDTIAEFRDGTTDFEPWVTTPQIVVTGANQETC